MFTRGVSLLGESPRVREIAALIPKLALSRAPVLLLGESGTGKDVVARAIHEANPKGAFVPIDCTVLAGTLFESELFGHVKGAFTGAIAAKAGLIQLADGGTAYFDEIGDVPAELQVKLLQLLQRKEFRAVGSPAIRRADFRVIAATNRELAGMVEAGQFRRDLYYRLKVITLRLPPLRERKEDIVLLAQHFLEECGPQYRFGPGVLDAFLSHHWPGNVRELQHCISAMVALASQFELDRDLLPSPLSDKQPAGQPAAAPQAGGAAFACGVREAGAFLPLAEMEKLHVERALRLTNWDCAAAARILRIGRTTLYRKMKEYGLERAKARAASSGAG